VKDKWPKFCIVLVTKTKQVWASFGVIPAAVPLNFLYECAL